MARFPGSPGAAGACARVLLLLLAVALPAAGSPARGGAAAEPPVLSGIVLDPLGRVLPGVEVRLAPAGRVAPPLVAVRTDAEGRFTVRGIRPGVYRLVAIKGGYAVFVDRVDTFLRRTLELVLHPARTAPDAARAVPDRSWALRLPGRDVLEDLGPGSGPGPGLRREQPWFALGLAPLDLDAGPGGHGNGVDVTVRGTSAPGSGRQWTGELRHRGARGRDGLLERNDRLSLSGRGNWGPAHLPLEVRAAAWRRESRRLDGEEGPGARGKTRGRQLAVGLRGDGGPGAWRVLAEWRSLRDEQDDAGRSSSLLSAGIELRRPAGARGTFRGRAVLRDSRRGLVPASGGTCAAGLAAGAPVPLEVLEGTSLELELGNEWVPRESVRLSVAFAGLAVDGAGTRWTGWSRVEWNPGGGWSLGAAGGVAAGGRTASEPGWSLGVRRDLSSWSWSLRRTRDAGPVPGGRPGGVPFLLLSREARLDAWTGGVTTRLGPAGLALHLEGTAGRLAGGAAPLLPGDLPLVPVVARARGRLLSLSGGVAMFAGNTRIGFTWERLDDRSPARVLAAGGRRWSRREVRLVQRLGALSGKGFDCELLLGYGRARVADVRGTASPARVALLRRSRVAGGLRVAF